MVFTGYCKLDSQQPVAIKEIDIADCDPEKIERELNILYQVGSLNHPNLVKLLAHYLDAEDQRLYLIMEKCEGGSLQDLIKDKKGIFSEDEIVAIALQFVEALLALHTNNISHRDLKPLNAVYHNHTLKLCDFGHSTNLCKHLTRGGTPGYNAPEYRDKSK